MKSLHAFATALGCALLCAALSPAARADAWNRKTFFTFSDSVEVPGAVLQAGNYVFKLMDSNSDRHIVQIMNDRENHVFATVLAISTERQIPPDKSVLTFYEVPAGNPAPIKKWYYPGDPVGQEFVYSGKRSAEILALGRQVNEPTTAEASPVVATYTPQTTTPEATAPAETTPAPDNNSVETPAATSATSVEPTAEPNLESPAPPEEQAAEPQQPATPAPATDTDKTTELPHTASAMPLVGLIGILSILSAVGVRSMRKSS